MALAATEQTFGCEDASFLDGGTCPAVWRSLALCATASPAVQVEVFCFTEFVAIASMVGSRFSCCTTVIGDSAWVRPVSWSVHVGRRFTGMSGRQRVHGTVAGCLRLVCGGSDDLPIDAPCVGSHGISHLPSIFPRHLALLGCGGAWCLV